MFFLAFLLLALTQASPPPCAVPGNPSVLCQDGPDAGDALSMATIGNGNVGWRIGSAHSFLNGLYNGRDAASRAVARRARVPSSLNITVTLDSEDPLVAVRSELNLTDGVFSRFAVARESRVAVTTRWWAQRDLPGTTVCAVVLNNTGAAAIRAKLAETTATHGDWKDVDYDVVPCSGGCTMWYGLTWTAELPSLHRVQVALAFTPTATRTVEVPAGAAVTVLFVSSVYSSAGAGAAATRDPQGAAQAEWALATSLGAEALLASHRAAWAQLRAGRGMNVGGARAVGLARAVNSSLYYLLSSVREDVPLAPSPGGLSGDGYNGHVFWDSETWMLPTLTAFWPTSLGEAVLQYRFDRLDGAREKARSYNLSYAGAMFPWESAGTGWEACPTWAATGLYEQHISGDIAVAVWNQFKVSRDKTWLSKVGLPLLAGIADFWVSRVMPQNCSISGVIPPDEYAYNVTDSVYTNTVARLSLLAAANASSLLGAHANPKWLATASCIPVLFDKARGIHPEFLGYTNATIKQADVILLGYPLGVPMPREVRARDLAFYTNVTDPDGPAMTWSMTAIAELELGLDATANFARGYANILAPWNVWQETPQGGTVNFLTGAGGFLQSIYAGYGGVRVHLDRMEVAMALPPNATSLALRGIGFAGSTFDLHLTEQGTASATWVSQQQGKEAPVLSYQGGQETMMMGKEVAGLPPSFEIGR